MDASTTSTRRSRTGSRRRGATRGARLRRFTTTFLPHAYVVAGLLFGGAGVNSPVASWFVVTFGLVILAQRLPTLAWARLDQGAKLIAWLVMATAALCLLQILPLPRGLWTALPGHALAAQIAAAAGGGGWTAWSLSPDRTLDALTALVPPIAGLVIAAQATSKERRRFLRIILIVALVSAVVAIIQVGAGPASAPVLFATRHRGLGVGFFVNRNHFALLELLGMLIVALPGIASSARPDENARATEWALRVGALALLSLGVIASLSRTGVFLLPVALGAAILLTVRRRVKLPVVLAGIGGAALLAALLYSAAPVQALLARYATAAEDLRFQYWSNTLLAARDALPLGTGFGTFTLVYPTIEPLDQIRPDVVNHAHNDFLELLLEAGIPGVLLLLAWIVGLAWIALRARGRASGRRERLLPVVVAVALALTLAASLPDYPVRMHAIALTLSLLVGMLLPDSSDRAGSDASSLSAAPHPARRRLAWSVPLVGLGLVSLTSQWGLVLASAGRATSATTLSFWYSPVQAMGATGYQLLGQAKPSSAAARRALALSPLNSDALRAEGMAAIAVGDRGRGAQLMSLGARLGWRDAITQLWLIEQALAAGANGFAIQRMDGLIRQGKFADQLLPLMPPLLRSPEGRTALSEQLAFDPGWRVAFFNQVARDRSWTMPQLLDVATRLRSTAKPLNPMDTGLIRAVLAEQGRNPDVLRVWRASGSSALVGDGEFEATAGELPAWSPPYTWYAPALTGVRLEAAQAEITRKGKALSIGSDGLAQGAALAQVVALTPGRYTLSLSASGQEPAIWRQLTVALGCRHNTDDPRTLPIAVPLTWSPATASGWQRATGSFAIPADCPGQALTVTIPQTNGRPFSLWIDSVSIRSAAGTPRA